MITYSVIVAQNTLKLCQLDMFLGIDVGKALFCALTHRLDKVGRYVYSFNEHKNVNAIKLSDNVLVPFGRGMSSIVLLSKFFPLTTEEEMAIRWSGGAWYEDQTNYNDLSIASKNKLVKLIQLAVSLAFS